MSGSVSMPGLVRPELLSKPRSRRLTMVLDKGMSVSETENWVEVAGPFVDVVKFGWGTSALFPVDFLQEKVEVLKANNVDVTPGGTLTEIYVLQNRLEEMVRDYRHVGFTTVEVSDGTIPMHHQQRLSLIRRLIAEGFKVVSEVGSKEPARDRRISTEERAQLVEADLDAGASHVIIEARESGTLGFFGDDKVVDDEALETFVSLVSSERVLFEAPLKSQQVALIKLLGSDVNLGNIPPSEVIALETLRQGLRADTVLNVHGHPPEVRMGTGPAEALAAASRGDVIVVVDALRASTTIAAALAAGVSEVKVVSRVDECVGDLTAAERGGVKFPGADLDNSPMSMLTAEIEGRSLVLTTTNGAECILAAASGQTSLVFVGSLSNCSAVAEAASAAARETNRNITVVSAGRNLLPAEEDDYTASEIILGMGSVRLHQTSQLSSPCDATVLFHESESGRNLVDRGADADVSFCAQKDTLAVVPMWRDGVLIAAT